MWGAEKYFDRVEETTAHETGMVYELSGATLGNRTFASVLSNLDYTSVCVDDGAGNWEVFTARFFTGSPNYISRGTLLASSTGSAVTFAAGSKKISLVQPAHMVPAFSWPVESSFNPTLASITGGLASFTYTTQFGRELQMGNWRFVSFKIEIATITLNGATGGFKINGPSSGPPANAGPGSLFISGPDLTNSTRALSLIPGSGWQPYEIIDNGAASALPITVLAAGDIISGSMVYPAS